MKKQKKLKFLDNSLKRTLKDVLIPTQDNEYKPKIFGSKSLSAMIIILIIIKICATLLLFFTYPDFAYLSSDIYNRIIEITNQTRTEYGVQPLIVNPSLNEAAVAKAEDMLLKQYFSHDSPPDGKKPWQWIDKKKYDYVNAGENLAMNFTSAEIVHSALLKSPTHKKNIVNPKYQDIGVAVLTGEMNGKKTMALVEIFGRQRAVQESNVQESKKTKKQESNSLENLGNKEIKKLEIGQKQDIKTLGESVEESSAQEIKANQLVLSKSKFVNWLLKYSNYILLTFICFLSIIFILNILIEIKIQHPAIILQSLTVIVIIIILAISKFHFIESFTTRVIID